MSKLIARWSRGPDRVLRAMVHQHQLLLDDQSSTPSLGLHERHYDATRKVDV